MSAPSRDEGAEQEGELYAIYLHPTPLGQRDRPGAARSGRRSRCASSGFRRALLWVLDGNERAERFYRAAGWEQDGRKVEDFQGATVTELSYRKAL